MVSTDCALQDWADGGGYQAYKEFWVALDNCRGVIHGSVALANLMTATDCRHWKPKNLNIALPRSGEGALEDFLRNVGYVRHHQHVPRHWRQSAKKIAVWCSPFCTCEIWVTRSVDDSVFPLVFGSTSTATMTFITRCQVFNFYPRLIDEKRAVYGMFSPDASAKHNHRLWGINLKPTASRWPAACPEACGQLRRRVRGRRGIMAIIWNAGQDSVAAEETPYVWWLGNNCTNPTCPIGK
jgi:hypothetical protein